MTWYWSLSTLAASLVAFFVVLNVVEQDRYGIGAFAAFALAWAIGVTAQLGV